eukprot:TRINITY_DN6588_c1_g1_i1.p1 TRINITY_DN6588_c1_g1~~TRINITY_DN6588_c1_g1_i1.p1  ORF type:complete len:1063 (+),score=239.52 TRINITY_DN6588_c1_g1_i1:142-3330(+)
MSDQDEGVSEILDRLRDGLGERVGDGVLDVVPEGILEDGIVDSAIEKLTYELRDPSALEVQKRNLRAIEKKLTNTTYDTNHEIPTLPPPPRLSHSLTSSAPRDVTTTKVLLEHRAINLLSQHPLLFPKMPHHPSPLSRVSLPESEDTPTVRQPSGGVRPSTVPSGLPVGSSQVGARIGLTPQAAVLQPPVSSPLPSSTHFVSSIPSDNDNTVGVGVGGSQPAVTVSHHPYQQLQHQHQQPQQPQPQQQYSQPQPQQPQVVVVSQPSQPEPDRATEKLAQALQQQLHQQQQVINDLQREVRNNNQQIVAQQQHHHHHHQQQQQQQQPPPPPVATHIDVGVKLPDELTEGLKQLLKDKRQTATRNVTLAIPRMFAVVEKKLRDRYFSTWQLFVIDKVKIKRARRKLQQLQQLHSNTNKTLITRYYDSLRRNVLVSKFGTRRTLMVQTLLGWMIQWRRRPYWDKWRRYKRRPHSEPQPGTGTNPSTVSVGTGGLPIVHKHTPVNVPVSSCTVSDMNGPPKGLSLLQHGLLNNQIVISKPADTLLPTGASTAYGGELPPSSQQQPATQQTNFRPFAGDPNVIMTEIEESMALREEQRIASKRRTDSARNVIIQHTTEAVAQRVLRALLVNNEVVENPLQKSKMTIQGPELEHFRKRFPEVTNSKVHEIAKKLLHNEVLRKKRPVRVEMATISCVTAAVLVTAYADYFCQHTGAHAGGAIITTTDVELLVKRILLQKEQNDYSLQQKLLQLQNHEKVLRSGIAIDALEFGEFTSRYHLIRRNHAFFVNLTWSNLLTEEVITRGTLARQCGAEYDHLFHRFWSSTISVIRTATITTSTKPTAETVPSRGSPVRSHHSTVGEPLSPIREGKEYPNLIPSNTYREVIHDYEYIIKEVDNVVVEDVPIILKTEDIEIPEDVPLRLRDQDPSEPPEDVPIRVQPLVPTFARRNIELPTIMEEVDDRVTRLVTDWFQGMQHSQWTQRTYGREDLHSVPTPSSESEVRVEEVKVTGREDVKKEVQPREEQRIEADDQSITTYTTTEGIQSGTSYSPSRYGSPSAVGSTITSYSK